MVKDNHGDIAEIILEEVLHQGVTTKDAVLETCLGRLSSTSKDPVKMDGLTSLFDIEFMRNRFDEGAGDVVSVIVALNNQLEGDMAQVSSAATYDQVVRKLTH
eukprot:sb/3478263/